MPWKSLRSFLSTSITLGFHLAGGFIHALYYIIYIILSNFLPAWLFKGVLYNIHHLSLFGQGECLRLWRKNFSLVVKVFWPSMSSDQTKFRLSKKSEEKTWQRYHISVCFLEGDSNWASKPTKWADRAAAQEQKVDGGGQPLVERRHGDPGQQDLFHSLQDDPREAGVGL